MGLYLNSFLRMKKQIIFITGILFFSIKLFSQPVPSGRQENGYAVAGIIQDKSSKQPIEFATVQLLHTGDSAIIKTTVTDHKGKFVLDKIATGNYILRCSFIGYGKTIMPVIVNQKKENVGIVEIGVRSSVLNRVVANGQGTVALQCTCVAGRSSRCGIGAGFTAHG